MTNCKLCQSKVKGRSQFCGSTHGDLYKYINGLDPIVVRNKLEADERACFEEYLMPSGRRVFTRLLSPEFEFLYGFSFLKQPKFLEYLSTVSIDLPIERLVSSYIKSEDLSKKHCRMCGSECGYSTQYRKMKEFCSTKCQSDWSKTEEGRLTISNHTSSLMKNPEVREKIKKALAGKTQEERSSRASNAARSLWDNMDDTKRNLLAKERVSKSLSSLEKRFREVHGDKYGYPNISQLEKIDARVSIVCKKHGQFEQYVFNHMSGQVCPKCSNSLLVSKPETEVFNFISKHTKTQQSNRSILNGKEVDIYCDNEKVGIEFNGVYWHSSNSEDLDPLFENKHLEKTTGCAESGVRLYHIFETEWYDKRLIWESVLVNAIGKTPDRLYARKCKVVEVDASRASEFLRDNHLQGRCGSSVRLGLEYEGELVSLMTFGKPRYNKTHDWELIRFCNLIFANVVGGASRLLSHFKRNYEGSIVSYANRRWSDGGVYEALGFKFIGVSPPSYYYVKTGEKLYHRSAFMKHKLSDKLEHFNPSMTEVQNMYSNGYRRIWDSGQLIFSLCQEVAKC